MAGDFETAKDLTQDVFVKGFEKLGSFDFKYRFFSWIYRIAVNEAINWSRKRPVPERLGKFDAADPGNADTWSAEEKSRLLNRELLKLDVDYRALVLLKYYQGLSYEEISETTGISVKKVRSRLFIAREQLRKGLIANNFFEND